MAEYEAVWLEANRYYDAEARFYEVSLGELQRRANPGSPIDTSRKTEGISHCSLASEIASARQRIQNILKSGDAHIDSDHIDSDRYENLQKQNENILRQIAKLNDDMTGVLTRVSTIENFIKTLSNEIQASVKVETQTAVQNGSSETPADDDDLDLFGSEEEDVEAAKLKEERLKAYANKKSKKPALVAKSSVVLDVKPWDDETDMKELEKAVRAVETEGLVWGASKLVPLAYGINKLQIVAIVEDDKVSIDWLQETISENDELVQSVDIAAFNKL